MNLGGDGVVKVPREALSDLLNDVSVRPKWDELCVEGHLVEQLGKEKRKKWIQNKHEWMGMKQTWIGEGLAVIRLCFHGMWPVKARDFCNSKKTKTTNKNKKTKTNTWFLIFHTVSFAKTFPDGTLVTFATSIDYTLCPVSSQYVRADTIIGGYVIKPNAENPQFSNVTYITHVDLKGLKNEREWKKQKWITKWKELNKHKCVFFFFCLGSIPTTIVNIANAKGPQCIHGIRKYLAKQDLSKYFNKPATT